MIIEERERAIIVWGQLCPCIATEIERVHVIEITTMISSEDDHLMSIVQHSSMVMTSSRSRARCGDLCPCIAAEVKGVRVIDRITSISSEDDHLISIVQHRSMR